MEKDPRQIKEKILSLINQKGPSIPIHLARELEMNTIFTSAFLGELVSEKQLEMSHIKVGGSPIYFLPHQKEKLESYGHKYLSGTEKQAFLLLQEKKFLKNSEQTPPIRVALASLKDFAKQEQKPDGLYWKYFTYKEEIPSQQIKTISGDIAQKKENVSSKIEVFEEKKEKPKEKTSAKRKTTKRTSKKTNEKFFAKVKEYLSQKGIQIIEIEGFSKNDLTLKIAQNEKTLILVAFNKKRIDEKDIIKANQKARELNLPYKILCLGDQTKKLNDFIDAVKNMEKIEKIE